MVRRRTGVVVPTGPLLFSSLFFADWNDRSMKTLTIALATAKEAIRQPAFFVLAFLAGASLIYTIFVPYFTFGEDIKMYKDTGLTTISFAALLLALLTASSSVAEEIEGKTAVTLALEAGQPPPVHHRQVPGDRAGRAGPVRAARRPVRRRGLLQDELRRSARWPKTARGISERLAQVSQVLPGLALGFFEVTVLTAISVAISTRLPMLVNLVVMIAIFFLGHLTPILVDVSEQANVNELVRFMARLFQWALPSLEFFNAGPSIATGACSSPGSATSFPRWDTACCIVERPCFSRSCCSRTATWPDPAIDPQRRSQPAPPMTPGRREEPQPRERGGGRTPFAEWRGLGPDRPPSLPRDVSWNRPISPINASGSRSIPDRRPCGASDARRAGGAAGPRPARRGRLDRRLAGDPRRDPPGHAPR